MWIFVVLLVAWLLYQGDGDPIEGATVLLDEIVRGARLTHAPYDKATGVVPGAPQDLADQAGASLEAYALARMLSSEEGRSSNRIKAAVAWCVVNEAARRGQSVATLLLWAKEPSHKGHFGTQKNIDAATSGYQGSDRYASTAIDPYAGDLEIATAVLEGEIADETNGANQFDRPSGEKDPDRVAANRMASGSELVTLDGIDDLRFWRRA